MAQFSLPKNSRYTEGRTWPKRGTRTQPFRIYRWNPDDGQNPRIDTYHVDRDDCGPMVLDALLWIKNKVDPTLAVPPLLPRGHLRLVRHEHPGRQHAGLHARHRRLQGSARSRSIPCRTCRCIKDLVPDLTSFFAQHAAIEPWLQTQTAEPETEWRQTPEERSKLDGLYECILCACCTTVLPELLVERRPVPWARGPAPGLSLAHRQPRRGHGRAPRHPARSVPALPLPHDHELRQHLPEGAEPREGHRRDQEDDDLARNLRHRRNSGAKRRSRCAFSLRDVPAPLAAAAIEAKTPHRPVRAGAPVAPRLSRGPAWPCSGPSV
jgi:succinate dehydrogenase / fumarate reductase iron-sulfur subunit